jgi:DNA-binding transcriptional LysR family regulator
MERSGRALRLTPQGRVLFETIGRALDEIDRVRVYLNRDDGFVTPLRIGAVTGFGRYRLAPLLFVSMPGARPILFRTGSHEDLLAALLAGEIDLAVTYRAVTAVPVESVELASEEAVLVGAVGDVGSLDAIERLRFITYDEYDYVFGHWFDRVFGRQPASLIRHDHCTELEEALISVRAGRGATIAPLDACLAAGLEPAKAGRAPNTLYLCGIGGALTSREAAQIRDLFA